MAIDVTVSGLNTVVDVEFADLPSDIDPETYIALRGEKGEKGDPGAAGRDGINGVDGVDGFSPSASVEKVGNTATISVTDKDGTTTASIEDGIDGVDGVDGVDGFSPSASVVKVGDTATITITDKDGTTTAEVYDGGASAFIAEYGVTPYADVKDAYDDGTIIICAADDSGNTPIFQLAYYDDANDIFYFAEASSDGWAWASIASDDTWDDGRFLFASTDTATQLRDGLMTALDKQKLDGIASGAEVNVQSDWNQSVNTADDFIKNKPTIPKVHFGTCTTLAGTTTKVVDCSYSATDYESGSVVFVRFKNGNTKSSPNLKVGDDIARAIYGTTTTMDGYEWRSGETVCFVADESHWLMVDGGYASTSYYGVTKLSDSTSSMSSSTAATSYALKLAYDRANSKYSKPSGGIPATDLASAVQTSLGLADTALQSETDPVFSASAASGITSSDIDNWDAKQDELESGVNIRTINGTSVLGSGDIEVAAGGTPIPTADTVAEFDSDAHINSEDMTSQEVEDLVDSLNVQGGIDLVKVQSVTANINKAFGNSVTVTAPTVSGYKFLCWFQACTSGWVGSVYPSQPLSATCTMWNATSGQSGTGQISCYALYIPSSS